MFHIGYIYKSLRDHVIQKELYYSYILTNDSLPIVCADTDDLHTGGMATRQRGKNRFHLSPTSKNRTTQDVICPTPDTNFTRQT